MRELTKSMLSFSWALSLFGMKQMSTLLAPGSRSAAGFEAVRRSTEEQLGPAGRSAFRTGDDLQRRMVDLMFGFFDLSVFNPNGWLRMGSDFLRGSAEAAGRARPGGCSGRRQPPAGWGPMPPVD